MALSVTRFGMRLFFSDEWLKMCATLIESLRL